MKTNFLKRLATLALTLVLVIGLMPVTVANAASKTTDTFDGLKLSVKKIHGPKGAYASDFVVTITDVKLEGTTLSVSYEITGTKSGSINGTFDHTNTVYLENFDCSKPLNVTSGGSRQTWNLGETTRDTNTEFWIEGALWRRTAHSFSNPVSNGNDTHTGNCSLCGEPNVTVSCNGGNSSCTAQAICDVCNMPYGKLNSHSVQHAAEGASVVQTCKNCTHRATATLRIKEGASLAYTGSAIEPVEVIYSSNWQNNKHYTLTYSNNVDVGTATCTHTAYGQTATISFTITKPYAPAFDFPAAATEISYGETLADAGLTFTENEYGTFAWKNPSATPDAGTADHTVVFTPASDTIYGFSNLDGYNAASDTVERDISVTVNPVDTGLTVSINSWTYGDTANPPVISTVHTGTPTYTYTGTVGHNNESYNSSDVPTLPGNYTVTVSYPAFGNYNAVSASANFAITRRSITVTAVDSQKTYGAADPAFTYTTEGGVVGTDTLDIMFAHGSSEDVGTYTLVPSGNHPCYDISFVNGSFEITPAALTVLTDAGQTKVYGEDDPVFTYSAIGLANGDTAADVFSGALSREAGEDAGDYSITQGTLAANDNYALTFESNPFVITPAPLTVTVHNKAKNYGAADPKFTFTVTGLVRGDTAEDVLDVETERVLGEDTGDYTISLLVHDVSGNYTLASDDIENGTLSIVPVSAVVEQAPEALSGLVYDGSQQTLISAGSAIGGEMYYSFAADTGYTAELPKAMNAGTYRVWYRVEADSNHTDSEAAWIDITIAQADPSLGEITANTVENTLDTSAIVLSRENTSVHGTLTVDAGQTLNLGENTVTWTFSSLDSNYCDLHGEVDVNVIDTIAPTGKVTLAENMWDRFLEIITFGLYYNDTQTVTVTAEDSFSGIGDIEYFESSAAMSLEEVQAITDWTAYNGAFDVTLEDAKQFIYIIRLTDHSGNIAYLSTDGAEYDTTAPVFTGADNGATCYTTQIVEITDKNLANVTLNGESLGAAETVILPGNVETVYTVVATDKAGNETTLTVNMLPIASIGENIEDLTTENVTSEDADALEAVLSAVSELLDDSDLTEEERAALEDLSANTEELLDRVTEAWNAAETDDIDATQEITDENVKPDDKDALEGAKEDLEGLLGNYGGNYTEEETRIIEENLQRIEDALAVIEAIETLTDAVEALPETFEPDDLDAVNEVLDAAQAYHELSEHGKSYVDESVTDKLDALVAMITAYDIISGDNFVWDANAKDVTVTANGAFSKFLKLLVDGKEVDAANYDAKSGSTIVTLKASYLETLSAGKHTMTFVYTDGETEGSFEIKALASTPDTPKTGDEANLFLLVSLLTVSLAALTALVFIGRKRKS